jgi:hypothetical protein
MRQWKRQNRLEALGWMLGITLFGALICPTGAEPTKEIVQQPKKTASTPAAKKPPAKPKANPPVDKKEVEELYNAGEFDQLIALLENMRRERGIRDREDSIFIYKYLGVVYGADMSTRRKAESFLYQMLKLDPKQDLVDLEVGDAILDMFHEVRKRYDRTAGDTATAEERERMQRNLKAYGYPIDSAGRNLIQVNRDSSIQTTPSGTGNPSSPQPKSAAASTDADNERMWLWVAGGAAAVTLAGVATILLMSEPDVQTTTYETDLK